MQQESFYGYFASLSASGIAVACAALFLCQPFHVSKKSQPHLKTATIECQKDDNYASFLLLAPNEKSGVETLFAGIEGACTSYPQLAIQGRKAETFLLSVDGGKHAIPALVGRPIYLRCDGSGLHISNEPSFLTLTPTSSRDGVLQLDVDTPKSSIHTQKKVVFTKKSSSVILKPSMRTFIQSISNARALPPDMLIEHLGGSDFEDCKGCFRLFLPSNKKAKTLVYFRSGDVWYYTVNGEWTKEKLGNAFSIHCDKVSKLGIECIVLDDTGLYTSRVIFPIEKIGLPKTQLDQSIKRARRRTKNTISCLFNKKNMLIKVGDWIVNLDESAHVVQKKEDIIALLQLDIEKEVFIVQSVEKKGSDTFLNGIIYDKTRSIAHNVLMPLATPKGEREGPARHHSKEEINLDFLDMDF